MAMGMDVVPMLHRFSVAAKPGASTPAATPAPMATKIHSVR